MLTAILAAVAILQTAPTTEAHCRTMSIQDSKSGRTILTITAEVRTRRIGPCLGSARSAVGVEVNAHVVGRACIAITTAEGRGVVGQTWYVVIGKGAIWIVALVECRGDGSDKTECQGNSSAVLHLLPGFGTWLEGSWKPLSF
jgi:hypothetical protein